MTGGRPPVVEARGLRKEYPGVLAVDDASFAVAPGEVLGLVGKNGAGKSTVIKMLAGLVHPDAGEILVDGEPQALASSHAASLLGISVVHQELALVPRSSVAENVFLGLPYPRRAGLFVDWGQLHRRTREVLERLGLDVDPRTSVDALSVAQQRMVMIARCLAWEARVVVLDEPTASLTDDEISHLLEVIRQLADAGVAIVYVSHRLEEILGATDRVVVMRDGSVVADLVTESLTKQTLVAGITGEARASESQTVHVHRSGRPVGGELLRVTGLTREPVLHGVDLVLREGEVLGLAGLVGAGRTELARLLFGVDTPDSGTITVRGKDVVLRSPRAAMRERIALLPEDRRHQGNDTAQSVRQNTTLPTLRRHRGVGWLPRPSADRERSVSREMIGRLGIKVHDPEVAVGTLSGGNQQKVVLAKWLVHGADVFVFDEPTAGIDVEGKADVYGIVGELADAGKAVLFISSDLPELAAVSDRVVVLREGRVVAELNGDEVAESVILHHCYGGEAAVATS
ncbi:sugar ABC transporter ATP-binding protein [Trujillonella humicola]|uniref:sugar ABC transporter ATP-binding protein n=1 Tax=Trujillonella humicola TaxID=3383699 RepID=UPI003905EA42